MSSNRTLADFAARLREFIRKAARMPSHWQAGSSPPQAWWHSPGGPAADPGFNELALRLFALQFDHNPVYRAYCEARGVAPQAANHWSQVPAVPTSAFKELELTCLPAEQRTTVFYSSGTTGERPSRHFHNADSLAVYEASLWTAFATRVVPECRVSCALAILTPPRAAVPHSSLVRMFEAIRRGFGSPELVFLGKVADDGAWRVNLEAALERLREAVRAGKPAMVLGTAFSFVHLLDYLGERNLPFELPGGSRVLETGGYKGRSRSLPKANLHALITARLGVPATHIVCEYGMSELSSQAYDQVIHPEGRGPRAEGHGGSEVSPPHSTLDTRHFHFPPWARVQVISPETGREAGEGETGLIRVFDLANVYSVMAIQTEDLGVRRGDGFELIGRAALAEPRGCSLLAS